MAADRGRVATGKFQPSHGTADGPTTLAVPGAGRRGGPNTVARCGVPALTTVLSTQSRHRRRVPRHPQVLVQGVQAGQGPCREAEGEGVGVAGDALERGGARDGHRLPDHVIACE